MQKYCEEEMEVKDDDKMPGTLEKKKKRLEKWKRCWGVDLATNTQNHKDVAVKNRSGFVRTAPPPSDRTPNPPVNTTVS